MALVSPDYRVFRGIRADMLGSDGPTLKDWLEEERQRHEAISRRAVDLFKQIRPTTRAIESGWFFDPESVNPDVPELQNAYMLSQGKLNGRKLGPEIVLWAGVGDPQERQGGKLMLAGTFNTDVGHGNTDDWFGNHRSQGLSTYDGSPINSYGARYGSPYPALPSETAEFRGFSETLDFIEQAAAQRATEQTAASTA